MQHARQVELFAVVHPAVLLLSGQVKLGVEQVFFLSNCFMLVSKRFHYFYSIFKLQLQKPIYMSNLPRSSKSVRRNSGRCWPRSPNVAKKQEAQFCSWLSRGFLQTFDHQVLFSVDFDPHWTH